MIRVGNLFEMRVIQVRFLMRVQVLESRVDVFSNVWCIFDELIQFV